jgi:hypothetical protein
LTFDTKKQGKKWRPRGPQPMADLVSGVLDPLMQRRAGMTMQLIMAWDDIIGPAHAGYTRPEKFEWPKAYGDNDSFKPAMLIIACDGARAIYVQHETNGIINRINTFFGFTAVDRIKIVQKPVVSMAKKRREKKPPLGEQQRQHLDELLQSVEDEGLRNSLRKMGEGVLRSGG